MSDTKTYAWKEIGTLIADAGYGGDPQSGPSYSRRFQLEREDGLFANITTYSYATTEYREVDDDGFETGDSSYDEHDYILYNTYYGVTDQVEYLICTDRDDLGGTEVNSDYSYSENTHDDYTYNEDTHVSTITTHDVADQLARKSAEAKTADFCSYWNGDMSTISR